MRSIKKDKPKSEDEFLNSVDDDIVVLDPGAPRNYKAVSLPLNQYEFELLEKAAKKDGRSQKNFLRMILVDRAKSILK